MRHVHAAVFVLLLAATGTVSPAVHSQAGVGRIDARRELLDRLTGHWVMRGVIGKRQTTHDIDALWILDKEYVQIHETARDKDASGKPQYEAFVHVVWDAKVGEYACLWLDTTGIANFPPEGVGHAKPGAADTITFVFTDPAGGIRTTFAYDRAKDAWLWTIDNEASGNFTPFARLTLTRS
jgi:hypothetical protein